MRKTTTEEKIENILIARAMLDDIPNSQIVHGLRSWTEGETCTDLNHCGSAACFGGWIAVHPYFRQKYGIRASRETYETHRGAPRTRSVPDPDRISYGLFGTYDAFNANETIYYGGPEVRRISDRALIKRRLEKALNELVKQL